MPAFSVGVSTPWAHILAADSSALGTPQFSWALLFMAQHWQPGASTVNAALCVLIESQQQV